MVSLFKGIGLPELIIIAILILVFVGGKKIRELSSGLGTSAKELKKIKRELTDEPKSAKKPTKEGGAS